MTHKEIAVTFLQLVGFGKVKAAFDQFVADDFIHHNQYFEGNRSALQNAMEAAHLQHPNNLLETKYVYEDQNTVIAHSLVKKEDMDIAVVHIFRFENDKIVELWDLGQVIEKNAPNKNGLF
ncbi:MAG: nuclear transport factor 2 family protein [Chitinophagales bacterium]|nr:nuclear transport factor 2 family protein [Chitinophagales bacterium]